ncbi:hypothetical protein BHE74_00020000 [Ensete ventricosum]|nr:hypothetical protein BHE74_00020000 [Ensete ventricosum]
MEETPTSPTSLVVSSPRRTLSLLRERRQKHPVPDPDEKTAASAAAAFAEEHGPKPSEVYGFVGSITTVIAAGVCPLTAPDFLRYVTGRHHPCLVSIITSTQQHPYRERSPWRRCYRPHCSMAPLQQLTG